MRRAALGFAAAVIVITGCTRATKPLPPPKPTVVTVTKYVRIPEALTQPCPIEPPRSLTVHEAVRIAAVRKAALEQCNKQLDAIRELGNP